MRKEKYHDLMIKKRLLAACMAVILFALPMFSACKGAENELMDVPTEEASDEDELDSQWVLSEEMMKDDHLYAEVKG